MITTLAFVLVMMVVPTTVTGDICGFCICEATLNTLNCDTLDITTLDDLPHTHLPGYIAIDLDNNNLVAMNTSLLLQFLPDLRFV